MALDGIWWPLLLSTSAGLSTSIGAAIAILRTPDESMLAFLLGAAIGVMGTVSCGQLWWHKAAQQGSWLGMTAAVAAGAVVFALLDPLLPKAPEAPSVEDCYEEPAPGAHVDLVGTAQVEAHAVLYLGPEPHLRLSSGAKVARPDLLHLVASNSRGASATNSPRHTPTTQAAAAYSSSGSFSSTSQQESMTPGSGSETDLSCKGHLRLSFSSSEIQLPLIRSSIRTASSRQHCDGPSSQCSRATANSSSTVLELKAHHSGLLRLGLLMAVTMTLHNLPEGFAVAFSAYTGFGKLMALAIAVHNIPEGLVIAMPIYAATNSKLKAIGLAAASGLSEPLGALIALFIFKPFVNTLEQLDYVLAFVGGIMLAVCALELWPEGRKCRQDLKLGQGIILGSLIMGWTLVVGV